MFDAILSFVYILKIQMPIIKHFKITNHFKINLAKMSTSIIRALFFVEF